MISAKDIKALRHVRGGRVFLSLVWTEPRSYAAARSLTEEGTGVRSLYVISARVCTQSEKLNMSFLMRTHRLYSPDSLVFNHLNLAVFVHFDLRCLNSHESNASRLLFNPSIKISKPLIKRCTFFSLRFQSADFGNRTLVDLLNNECVVCKLSGSCSQQMR